MEARLAEAGVSPAGSTQGQSGPLACVIVGGKVAVVEGVADPGHRPYTLNYRTRMKGRCEGGPSVETRDNNEAMEWRTAISSDLALNVKAQEVSKDLPPRGGTAIVNKAEQQARRRRQRQLDDGEDNSGSRSMWCCPFWTCRNLRRINLADKNFFFCIGE